VHEVALANAVWRQVRAEMDRHPESRLVAVNLVAGRWSGADPESLEFALRLLVDDSAWRGAAIRIRSEPLALKCRACGRQFEPEQFDLACPACGGVDVEPIRGRDLYLESLEVE
jgi:hydrogenase nickel incorporation protein HypA/HybF